MTIFFTTFPRLLLVHFQWIKKNRPQYCTPIGRPNFAPRTEANVNILISKHIYSYCTNRRPYRSITHSVDGFLETVSRASIHLHKSKSVVVPRIYDRWQHALRHTIWSSHLKHKITQTKNLNDVQIPTSVSLQKLKLNTMLQTCTIKTLQTTCDIKSPRNRCGNMLDLNSFPLIPWKRLSF
jgi:hypothetical protein